MTRRIKNFGSTTLNAYKSLVYGYCLILQKDIQSCMPVYYIVLQNYSDSDASD